MKQLLNTDGQACRLNKLQLFRLLRRHIRLAEKRSVAYEQNKTAKFLIYLMGAFVIIYMIFIAILLALTANSLDTATPYEFFFGLLPFFLVADFLFRFIGQQTPAQLIKPYVLLPIPKYTCIELFIASSIVTPNNFIWLSVTVPYVIMTLLFNEGFFAALGLTLAFQLLITVNSQWYMLVRTLINKSMKWWLLPVAVYALVFMPLYLYDFDTFFDLFAQTGPGFAFWHPLNYICVLAVLAAFAEVNKRIQFRFTYLENAGAENVKMKKVSEFHAFDKYGEVGEYLKLEVKSLMRNKNIRKSFIFATAGIILLSLVISFSDLYEDRYSRAFWIVYTFVLYGAITLIKIMSAEGNYIDCLVIHKENIMQLLRAKYYFYASVLLLPFLLMLPTVFTGKYTLLMLVSMMCFTAGPIYCLLMQMAVYNRQTMPLNTKFISKGNIENNYFQVIAELAALFLPVIFIFVFQSAFSENMAYIILMSIGIVFILCHKIWIANIYKRFMKRRYKNMESFRATR